MLKTFKPAVIFLWREWRAGEWLVVVLALLIAVTATTSIELYTNRLARGLYQRSTQFFGGDLVVSSFTPIPKEWKSQARYYHLRSAEVWSYSSIISTHEKFQLVNLQAVSSNYPLIGKAKHIKPHTIWVESRLLPLLSLKVNDGISIGTANFRIASVLNSEKDSLYTGWIIAPRILMRLDDVPATHTVIPGSHVDYRLLLAGDKDDLQSFKAWLTPKLKADQNIQVVQNQQLVLTDIMQRTQYYLQLIVLICLLLSGVAIALSIQQYLRRHFAHVALWRCFGATKRQITQIFIWQLLIIATLTGIFAISLGYLSHILLIKIFRDFLQFPLPLPSISPFIFGFITCILILSVFAFPLINKLPNTSPLFIWRNQIPQNTLQSNLLIAGCVLLMFLFLYIFMGLTPLTLFFIISLAVIVTFLYFLCYLIINIFRFILKYMTGAVRRGLNQIVLYPKSVTLQFIGFNLIFTSLIVLSFVRGDLIRNWQMSLSNQTPNYFAFNIAPKDIHQVKSFFAHENINLAGIYPMVRGRLIELNDKPILSAIPKKQLNNTALHRELNLSWMWKYPEDNKIVVGNEWELQDKGKQLVSVLYKFATDLHLRLGDKLTFQIGDKKISAIINNFRTLNWTSFHPNFYIIFPPGLINQFPTTYVTSFYLSNQQPTLLNQLIKRFPNVTIIDVASLLQQMQTLIGRITLSMQYVFALTLISGFLIFVASLQASMDERRRVYTLLSTLGASKQYIRKSLIVEFSSLLLLIVLTSTSFAWLIVFLLERYIFLI